MHDSQMSHGPLVGFASCYTPCGQNIRPRVHELKKKHGCAWKPHVFRGSRQNKFGFVIRTDTITFCVLQPPHPIQTSFSRGVEGDGGEGIHVRTGSFPHDIHDLSNLHAVCFYGGRKDAPLQWCFNYHLARAEIQDRIRDPKHKTLLAVSDTNIFGSIDVIVNSSWTPKKLGLGRGLYLSALGVFPEFRRRGVSQLLIGSVVELAQSYGADYLFLHVLKKNTAAVRAYEKMGFVQHPFVPLSLRLSHGPLVPVEGRIKLLRG
mmetsp:Transcript_37224/g.60276  ORF Transcript_37224/g.60276 Transcript_37224/m.60276 type:complete len:262 (+) Transcript_37224:31-816(+)